MKRFVSAIAIVFAATINIFSQNDGRDSVVFNAKSKAQTWQVPDGITKIYIDAYGAQGGSEKGGKGGRVQSTMTVSPGTKLSINVGSQPTDSTGGLNGGGKGCGNGYGGGGATDIRVDGDGLNARILVAGGGGGAGYAGIGGGAGGGLTGGEGKYDTSSYHIAKGGTQTEGGAGARAYFSAAGKEGAGGEGRNSRGHCTNNAMGGGGGGYYGGGGSGAGGAGGGSSYTDKNNRDVKHTQGINSGDGRLVIYWDRPRM